MEMAGQRQNIIQAIKDYGERLFDFIRSRVSTHEDAEDILQDVWYKLSGQARLGDIESISGWLYHVAKNKITDAYRKKKNLRLNEPEDDDEILPAMMIHVDYPAEATQLRKLFWETLPEALQELPPEQRNVFIWNELEEKTLQEIADREKENEAPRGKPTGYLRRASIVLNIPSHTRLLYLDFPRIS
jgi:RNA polymerase sigma factor (sigma-70 family)